MPSPGWYPDPQDSAGLRWFDGENWSQYRQPGTGEPAADADATQTFARTEIDAAADPAATSVTGGLGGLGTDVLGTDGPAFAPATLPASAAADTAVVLPPVPAGADPYAARAGYLPAADVLAPAAGGVTFDYTPQAPDGTPADGGPAGPPAPPAPARGSHAGGGRAKLDRNRVVLIVGLVVAVVAALLVGGWALFLRGDGTSFTYHGKAIDGPKTPLAEAEANLTVIAGQRHAATSPSSTRCYYAVPEHPTSGKKTDVDSELRCGPVLFVDGDTSKEYLAFALSQTGSGDSVTLAPSAEPESSSPSALPAGFTFKRPDGKSIPSGNGGLQPPAAPAADPNVLTATVVNQPAGTTPTTASIGSLVGGIAITDIGKVSRFGTGDSARSAPPNQQLYAFRLGAATGNSGEAKDLSAETTISVDGAAGRALPTTTSGQSIVIAVPSSTKALDLILTDSGLRQTYSLVDHKPGAGNIAVLARAHRSVSVDQTVTATYNYSTKVVFGDGTTGQTQTASIKLGGVTLAYRDDVNAVAASGPDKAFLIPDIVYTGSHDGGPYGVNTALLTFTPTGGAAITAQNVSTDPKKIRNVFEVPANVTTGTLTIGGTTNEQFSGTTGTYVLTVAAPMSFQLTFPAG